MSSFRSPSSSAPRFFSGGNQTPGEMRRAATGSGAPPVATAPASMQDPMATLRRMTYSQPKPDEILAVFRHIELAGPPAGIARSMFTELTKQIRDKWGATSWTRSVMVQHAQVQMRFPEVLEPEPEPEPEPQPARRHPAAGGAGAHAFLAQRGRSTGDSDDEDEDAARREMEASMRQVEQLAKIRELQRRNVRDGIGDAEGRDERVVAMYAALIDTAGLSYQGVVQHEKVAKSLSKLQLDRIPAKQNPSPNECSLCLDMMPAGLRVATLPCCGGV